ncbi:MAG: helicase-related protein [Roseiarcus sp.]
MPAFEWPADANGEALVVRTNAYGDELCRSVAEQLKACLEGDGVSEAWRDVRVLPEDVASAEKWNAFLARARATPPTAARVLPNLSAVVLKVDRQIDFLNPTQSSFRVLLDNQCQELAGRDAQSVCNVIFGTGLTVVLPAAAHKKLHLDRVEPSYRFRHHLDYPAIGLNCGIQATQNGDSVALATTWSPRFVQPRIVPTKIDVACEFTRLADPAFPASQLLELARRYRSSVKDGLGELKRSVRDGLSPPDADAETVRLQEDTKGQLAEADYIERGVRLLIEAQTAAFRMGSAKDDKERETLRRRALPWFAWSMTNEAFARRDGNQPNRGWRLFQLAFILAHVPTFASRLPEYRKYQDPFLDEDSASLLYFPTGGGKSEAFYGTLLFAIFLDRLRGKDRGVSALIRYPLRLLTLQQAQRLLKLIVHGELVRNAHQAGSWPIEIGFWVGSSNTPNSYSGIRVGVPRLGDAEFPDDKRLEEDASQSEEDAERGRRYREVRDAYNKVPECLVCGRATGLRRNETEGPTAKRAAIVCFGDDCDWNRKHGGIHPLPFLLTDDTIYERAPAIVLGTIDKLAMLGQHTGTVAKVLGMFGLARWIDPNGHLQTERRNEKLRAGPESDGYRPVFTSYRRGESVFFDPFPSLIIQDEAHLLEESLGTFSGLFDSLLENVFTQIARIAGDELRVARKWAGDDWGDARMPKVVAATSTISNPERQLETLYQRYPLQFPYPGPDIYHSFFAEPAAPPSQNAERSQLARELPLHLAPEATSPWMRLYISLMTNGANHTVTAVEVLSAFHLIIARLWRDLRDPIRAAFAVGALRDFISPGQAGNWRRAAIDRAVAAGKLADIMALVDLHRIAIAYVTNKKGGDQIIDALDVAVRQLHKRSGLEISRFDSRLISGGVDMKEIQRVMGDASRSFENMPYPKIDDTVRNIVATAAISHGVDVDRFNSMFFAGLPSDIAEYIQASSRVGRAHVGFVMLLPAPQNRRDRYVVETHDIFHRFLERMIAPPAVERWAENAVRRVLASFVQTWTMLKEADQFIGLDDDNKGNIVQTDMVRRLGSQATNDTIGFRDDLGNFILQSSGYAGRGPETLGAPPYAEHYRGLVDNAVQRFADDMSRQQTAASLRDYWEGQTAVFQKPMTSLRDVDEAGYIVSSSYDPLATERTTRINLQDLARIMRCGLAGVA